MSYGQYNKKRSRRQAPTMECFLKQLLGGVKYGRLQAAGYSGNH